MEVFMLGISVYFKDFDEDYVTSAVRAGVKAIFTSLQIPEDDFSRFREKLSFLLKLSKENDVLFVPDISPESFKKLSILENDFRALKEMGFQAVRLDYGFEDFNSLKNIQKDFQLFINASTVSSSFLKSAESAGIDISKIHASHNFYPKVDTGLSIDYFDAINQKYIENNVDIMAFVNGDKLMRFPFFNGLPTIEAHRGMNPYVASVELTKHHVKDVVIGDSQAKISTLQMISDYLRTHILKIPVLFEPGHEELINKVLQLRRDESENIVRIISERSEIPIRKIGLRNKGTITQDNILSGRYSGELQVIKKRLSFSADSNVVGTIHPDYLPLIDLISGHREIALIDATNI